MFLILTLTFYIVRFPVDLLIFQNPLWKYLKISATSNIFLVDLLNLLSLHVHTLIWVYMYVIILLICWFSKFFSKIGSRNRIYMSLFSLIFRFLKILQGQRMKKDNMCVIIVRCSSFKCSSRYSLHKPKRPRALQP